MKEASQVMADGSSKDASRQDNNSRLTTERSLKISVKDDSPENKRVSISNEPRKTVDRKGLENSIWNTIVLISSILAVSLDVLFFFIFYIDDERKCFAMDKMMRNMAVLFRTVTDFVLLLHIIFQICSSSFITELLKSKLMDLDIKTRFRRVLEINKKLSWTNILIHFLALLPIPQVVVLGFFGNKKTTRYLQIRWHMCGLQLLQFAPRIVLIFLLCKKFSRTATPTSITGTPWFIGAFNFCLYILASHVAGAFWYFFAVERELYCWQKTCKAHIECKAKSFFCDDITGNEKFVDKFCPVNPPDPSIFDFGIFLDAHQNGVSRLKNFPLKLLYCFSWGLRTLSSFGSNLNPSICSFENIFTVLVSITGILLVVYLIGNLQIYLQSSTSRSEQRRRLMQGKENEIESWIKDYDIQCMKLKNDIMQCIREKFDENEDVNLKNLLNIFPTTCFNQIKEKLFSTIQERDSKLKILGEDELKRILGVVTKHVKPVIYAEDSYIIQEGEPLYQMIFLGRGIAWAYSGSSSTECLERGGFFGEELVNWALEDGSLTNIPLSTKTVKSQIKVEAFAVMAHDLKTYLKNPPTPKP